MLTPNLISVGPIQILLVNVAMSHFQLGCSICQSVRHVLRVQRGLISDDISDFGLRVVPYESESVDCLHRLK